MSSLRRVTFLLPEKSPKGHLRGFPLDIPFSRRELFFFFRHEGIEWANHRPRSPAPAVREISLCFFFGVPCLGGEIHRRTISSICESGNGRQLLQCMAARAGRRSWMRKILVGETTDGTSLLLMRCMSQRQKTGSPKPTRFRRSFGYFSID